MISTPNVNTANISINGLSERSGQSYYQRRNIAMPSELEELSHERRDRAADVMPSLDIVLTGRPVNGIFKPSAFLENDDRDTNKQSCESENNSLHSFGNAKVDLILSLEGNRLSPESLTAPLNVFELSQVSPSDHLTVHQNDSEANKTSFITDGSNRQLGAEEPNCTLDYNELDDAMGMFREIQSKLSPAVFEQALKKLVCQLESETRMGCHEEAHIRLTTENEKLKADYLELLNTLVDQKKKHADAIVELQMKFATLNYEYSQLKQREESINKIDPKDLSMNKSGISNSQIDKNDSKRQLAMDELAGETIEEIDLTCQRDPNEFSNNNITCVGPINETPRSASDNFESLRHVLVEGNCMAKAKKFEFPKPDEINHFKSDTEATAQPKIQEHTNTQHLFVEPYTVSYQAPYSEQTKHHNFNSTTHPLLSPICTPRANNAPELHPGNAMSYQRPYQPSDLHNIRTVTHYLSSKDNLNCNTQTLTKVQHPTETSFRSSQTGAMQPRGKVTRISISGHSNSIKNYSSNNPLISQIITPEVISHPVTHTTVYSHSQSPMIQTHYQMINNAPKDISEYIVGGPHYVNGGYEQAHKNDQKSWKQHNLFLESERNLEPLSPQNMMTFLPRGTFGRQVSPSFSPNKVMFQGPPYVQKIQSVRASEGRLTTIKERDGEGKCEGERKMGSEVNLGNDHRVSTNGFENDRETVFRFTNN